MAEDIGHSKSELEILFQDLVLNALGYSKTGSPSAYSDIEYSYVRVSWPTYGAPAWKVTEDVTFLRVAEDADPYNVQREDKFTRLGETTLNQEETRTKILSLSVICYGPNSWDNAELIRNKFFGEEIKYLLGKEKIYMLPDIDSTPQRRPESFNNQWWERVDVEFRFNEKIAVNETIDSIGSAEILIYSQESLEADITVSET